MTKETHPVRPAQRRSARLLAVLLALSLTATACGGDDDDDGGASAGDEPKTEDVSGTVNVSGSSTVEPISTAVAEDFSEIAPDVVVNVDGPGTGDGFKLFCEGETDVSDASRPIKKEEADACAAAGIEYVELKIALDGLSVITHPDNDIECLSFPDLYALTGPESKGFKNWSDARALAKELGSTTTFPGDKLVLAGPGEESGTYDSYVEIALEKIAKVRAEDGKISEDQIKTTRPDYQSSGDDNVILQAVEGAKSSLGWVGLSYALESGDQLRQIPVSKEAGGDCVSPTAATVKDGSYPLSRALYIYVKKESIDTKPAVTAYVDYYLSDDGIRAVTDVDYVDLSSTDLEETRAVWEAKTVGTRDGGK